MIKKTLIVPKDMAPMPLSDYLVHVRIPRKTRHFIRTKKHVWINDSNVPFHTLVKPLDRITLQFDDSDYPPYVVQQAEHPIALDILYEDDDLIIINKPIHLKTHPNEPTETTTLLNAVATYLNDTHAPYVVHRLDMETSGCILFAKNPVILPLLTQALEHKHISRRYEALVHGTFTQKDFTINAPIGRDRNDKRKRCIDKKHGQTAITHVHVMHSTAHTSRISCTLDTGRTHQIRVHLASKGHPIVGDPLYQKKASDRLYLHAASLTFYHPFKQKDITVYAPTPF